MQQVGNIVLKLAEIDEDEAAELTPEEIARRALEKAARESFTRLYLPSGVIFLSVKKARWSFFFGGNYANPPRKVLAIGETWEPAAGAFRLKIMEGLKVLYFLWDFLCGTLNPKIYLDIRNEDRAIRFYQDPENRTICLHFIDNENCQSTKFYLEDHRILDLYLGMLAGFRSMMRGKFANSEAAESRGEKPDFEGMQILEAHPLGRHTVDMVIKNRHVIIRNAVVNNEVFRITQAHAPVIAHALTANLCRNLKNRISFSDYLVLDMPGFGRINEDDYGRVVFGPFRASFSPIHTPFLVAIHLGVTHLIDGLPMHIYR